MDTESIDKGISQGGRHWQGRVDWRSGTMAYLRDDTFWHRQPAPRAARALSPEERTSCHKQR